MFEKGDGVLLFGVIFLGMVFGEQKIGVTLKASSLTEAESISVFTKIHIFE